MKWYSETWEEKKARLETWHEYFAWLPERVGRQMFWMQTIYRKGKYDSGYESDGWEWTFAENEFDMLKEKTYD